MTGMSYTMVILWKEFGITKERFLNMWPPLIALMLKRYTRVYHPSSSEEEEEPEIDKMSINELKGFFMSHGMPIKEAK